MVSKKLSMVRLWLILVVALGSLSAPFSVYAIPDIQTWQTANGAKVLYVPSRGLPMVDIRIVFDAGSARDNGISGLAALTNGLLAEGAGGKTAQQLAESFESVGAQFSNDSLRDMAIVGVRTLTDKEYLQTAVDTLSTLLTQPDFQQKEYERELARMKVAVTARKQSPSSIAEEAFYKAIYGDHPYAEPSGGTEESMKKLGLDDIKAFYQQYYVAKNAVIIIVGDMDQSQAAEIANKVTADLPAGEKPLPLPEVQPLSEEQIIHIEYPSKQSHIYVGQPGTRRGDKDYFALYMGNHPFGGSGFTSRLVDSIREERGLAYSVYSYFSPMREAGPFMMGMQTRADQTDEAVGLLKSELVKYIEEGPTEQELKDSTNNVVGSFPLNLDSNKKLLGYLAMIGFYDLPKDYLQTFVANVEAVSRDDIKDALKRRLHADKMVTVIVGNGMGNSGE